MFIIGVFTVGDNFSCNTYHWLFCWQVLRGASVTSPDKIAAYNLEVVSNWKLLAKGQLELAPEYKQHLASSLGPGLSQGQRQLAEQEVLVEVERRQTALPRPQVAGEWASIVRNYRETLEDKQEEEALATGGGSMFGENTVPSGEEHEVSPYGGTSILRTDVDLAREKPMDSTQFKEEFLSEKDQKGQEEEKEENPWRRKYLAWVRGEEWKDRRAAKSVAKLDVSEVAEKAENEERERRPSKWRKASEQVETYLEGKEREKGLKLKVQPADHGPQAEERPDVFVHSPASRLQFPVVGPDVVEVPEELQGKGYSMYRVRDCYYDREGELVYRVPGLRS